MAKLEIDGFIEGIDYTIDKMGKRVIPASKMALYDGAGEMIEEVKREIRQIPEAYGYVRPGRQPLNGLLSKQIDGLLNGVGISKMKNVGSSIEVAIGFAGYNDYKTKQYPNGQPNALVRRSLVKGTPYLKANKFMTKASKNAGPRVVKVISEKFGQYRAQIINDK